MTNRRARPEEERLFIAIALPSPWLETLERHMDGVRSRLASSEETRGARVRWVRPEGIHLTLKFLGEVVPAKRRAIEATLAATVTNALDLRLEMGEVGAFGEHRVPRVLWVGVGGQIQELTALAGRVDAAMEGVGFAPERRPFAPHLTLARLSDDMPPALRQRVVQISGEVGLPACAPFDAQEVALFRSHLGPGGSRHEIVARWP